MVFWEITVRALAVRTHDSALFVSQVLLLKTCFIIKIFSNPRFEFRYARRCTRIPQTKALIPTCNTVKIKTIFHIVKHLFTNSFIHKMS